MHAILPDLMDPWRAAARREQYAGTVALTHCTRLYPLVLPTSGAVTYQVQFTVDADGYAVITGTVAAVLHLTCQRCLGVLEWPVTAQLQLALVHTLDEAEQLPERYEPWVITDRLMPPVQFLEDELLLALPPVPRHASDCTVAVAQPVVTEVPTAPRVNSLAAALADWKTVR